MTDLNLWRLAYPGVSLDFGPNSTAYPFSVQVDIGDTSARTEDFLRENEDGLFMGQDLLDGFELLFTLTTLPGYPAPAEPWRVPLDTMGTFKSKWRADSIRKNPFQYATLLNVDRGRLVYGRPRRFGSVDSARLRRGVVKYVAGFSTVGPNFYSDTEQTLALINANEVAGNNGGDVDSWGVITVNGPFTAGSIALKVGATTMWTLTVPGPLTAGQSLVIDTRPWARYALLGAAPANAMVRGDALAKASVPVGAFTVLWNRTDATNTSSASFSFRNAYASL